MAQPRLVRAPLLLLRGAGSCQDKAGVDESSKRAADWVGENASASVDPPEVTEGSAFLQF
jgi:hypothetical protein